MRILIVVLSTSLLAAAACGADWPQWLGPNRAGVFVEPNLLAKFPAAGPKVEWDVPVGLGYAGPAVAEGKVFLLDRVLAADAKPATNAFAKTTETGVERVRCFDAVTGKEVWTVAYDCPYRISYAAGPRCTPTVDGGRVYALGAMGDLHCLKTTDGAVVWKKQFLKDYESTLPLWGFASHPLIDGDKLICLVGGSNGRLVVAFDKTTGAEAWTSQSCDGDFGYNPPVIADLAGTRTLLIWHAKAIVGLDPATGKRLWSVPLDSKFALTVPLLRTQGDRVFASSFYEGSKLIEVTANGASIVWKSKARGERPSQTTDLSSIMATPVWKGEHIYGVDSYGELRCIEATTGKRVWSTMQATRGRLTPEKVRALETPSESQPWAERWSNAFLVPCGDKTLLFNEQGELIIANLTPSGYEEIDRAVILEPTNKLAGRPVVWMHPAFADGSMFARNDTKLVRVKLTK